jgi:hypothetical protein
MKQETLEEAKYNAYKEYWNENHTQEVKSNFLTAFKLGAKWQAERMYSEEEVLEILREFYKVASLKDFPLVTTIPLWFEKFKKK